MSRNKNKNRKIIILVILGIFLMIISTVFGVISIVNYFSKMSKIEYIELGNDKIPTIYVYDNLIKIDEYNKDITSSEYEIEITYYDNLYTSGILDKYIFSLEKLGFKQIDTKYNNQVLVKESIDKGNVIIISIDKDDYYDEFDITYRKRQDNISNYFGK